MPALEPLVKSIRTTHPKAELRDVARAYEVAGRCHRGQTHTSGDPYITHPLAVATILADLGMTPPTIIAALLHDTVVDTDYTLTALRRDFGDEVAALVEGVTKLDRVKFGEGADVEIVRKMIVATARDIRVLLIKLADRLHNMRTLRFLPPERHERLARETLEIYAPLAHRLFMNTIRVELEDLAFATLYPKRYERLVRLVSKRAPAREIYLTQVVDRVSTDLQLAKIRAEVTGRPKHYYSIYQKMIVRGRDFADIYDLVGIRVLVDSVRDCYAALGTIHASWNPVPGRFKDYVAMPKFNMYQSVHTTVIGPEGKPVEIQIRTFGMHRRAEYGVAAHWRHEEEASVGAGPQLKGNDAGAGNDMVWLRQLLDWQKETPDPGEFLESLKDELRSTDVYVFTPKGDVLALPSGSTPVDVAYAVHTEVGHACSGARINGRPVPLESTLENGDVVEISTSKAPTAGPSRNWLGFVKSPRARNQIRRWFAKEHRDDATEEDKDATPAVPPISPVPAPGGREGTVEDLAEGTTPTQGRRPRPAGFPGVVVKGASNTWVKLARCCGPISGDSIVGFVRRGNGVSVHRTDCVNVDMLRRQKDRIVEVEWAPTAGSVFLVSIQVEALDRTRLLSDVTRVLVDQHVDILSATVTTTRDRVAVSRFTFEMADPKHLGHVLSAVRRVEGVYDAYRVTSRLSAET